LHPTPGYHHITIAQPGQLIFLAGQMPMDDSGERVVGPGDLDAQVDRTVLNTQHALAVAEVRPEDVVRSVVYVVGTDESQLGRAWHRFAASARIRPLIPARSRHEPAADRVRVVGLRGPLLVILSLVAPQMRHSRR
jgi:enamine deaminase RidA (YjgF/YER057c/UK114 family)